MIKHTLAALVLASASALASADDMGTSSVNFSDLDANGDGRVSSTEASNHSQLNQGFRSADSNGDGYMSEAEFNAWSAEQKSATPTRPSDPATAPQSTSATESETTSDTAE
jgi:hypothetical protein